MLTSSPSSTLIPSWRLATKHNVEKQYEMHLLTFSDLKKASSYARGQAFLKASYNDVPLPIQTLLYDRQL